MNNHDLTYHHAIDTIIKHGQHVKSDRTGVGTYSLFGLRQEYDISNSFPAVTTKKLAWKAVVSELLWFIEGSGDERRLAEILHGTRDRMRVTEEVVNGEIVRVEKPLTTIWTANAEADYWKPKAAFDGDLGRVYGVQWRSWLNAKTGEPIDQLTRLVHGLKNDPHGRRHILTAWNVGELDQMALPPCHMFAQFYVREGQYLDCLMYQRSNDFFLGCPFNIASYSLLVYMIAHVTGYKPGRFIHDSGDAHVYTNHVVPATLQLSRTPFNPPTVVLNPDVKSITDFTMDDIKLVGYQSHDAIKAPMAV